MKRVLIITILMLAAALAQAQDTPKTPREQTSDALLANDEDPMFRGGLDSMQCYINRNLVYPVKARKRDIEGMVYIEFVVEADGRITHVRVAKDIGGGCGREAARVVANMPRWMPGEENGVPTRCKMTLPLHFKLDGEPKKAKK